MDQAAFELKLRQTLEGKAENVVIQPTNQRDQLIQDLLRINSSGAKSTFDFNLKKRYEVLCIGNAERLIRKRKDPNEDKIKFVASIEEVFGIVKAAHEAVGHGGGKKTIAEVKRKWSNITQEACYLYISFCEHCHQKRTRKVPKGLVVKPVPSHHSHSRCQIDLINFQTLPDGDFKYIMTFVNNFSKFCMLRPLKTKGAEEVAENLLDIFLTFGAPAILQSNNGQKFINAIIAELAVLWPELKLVAGRSHHPQDQGTVEYLNGVIQDQLTIWMKKNNSRKWSVGLKFVQWQINISRHETTGKSPFKVTFGQDPQVGLGSSILPSTALHEIFTEEDLEAFLESKKTENADTELPTEASNVTDTGGEAEAETGEEAEILEVVLKEQDELYNVGCQERTLGPKFKAGELITSEKPLINAKEVSEVCLSVRTATSRATGRQRYTGCQCTTRCTSGQGSCPRKKIKCNLPCHLGRSSKNL